MRAKRKARHALRFDQAGAIAPDEVKVPSIVIENRLLGVDAVSVQRVARRVAAVLKPDQWIKLIDRISEIDNPAVREQPSKFSVAVTKRASKPHRGE